uniref:Uncharacterized protein n=1 Tax=Physcomitrium patens TaxID=3218 RepID=A0A2K1KAP2_PHYPA|nr:hypothetical protein PHYPA_010028 [Physcomitrium patens]
MGLQCAVSPRRRHATFQVLLHRSTEQFFQIGLSDGEPLKLTDDMVCGDRRSKALLGHGVARQGARLGSGSSS